MKVLSEADVVLALGTRLGPFGCLPQYGQDYWPNNAKVIQIDVNARKLGLTKPVSVAICGDAKMAVQRLGALMAASTADTNQTLRASSGQRLERVSDAKTAWENELNEWSGVPKIAAGKKMSPRSALRALEISMPEVRFGGR